MTKVCGKPMHNYFAGHSKILEHLRQIKNWRTQFVRGKKMAPNLVTIRDRISAASLRSPQEHQPPGVTRRVALQSEARGTKTFVRSAAPKTSALDVSAEDHGVRTFLPANLLSVWGA